MVAVLFLACDNDKDDEFRLNAGDLLYTAWKGQVNWYDNGEIYYTKDVSFEFSSERTGTSKSIVSGMPEDPFITSFEYEFDGKCLKYAKGDGHLRGNWYVVSVQKDRIEFQNDIYENVEDRAIMNLERISD